MKIISFPHMGNYAIPLKFMVEKLSNIEVKFAPPISKKTLELGSKYAPDFVCIPFKYNLGNYIEALDNGANILIGAGGGCRFGYYGEANSEILKNLGYNFDFISIGNDNGKMNPKTIYKSFKKLNSELTIFKYLYYLLLTFLMVYFMDKLDIIIRSRIGFAKNQLDFINTEKETLKIFSESKGIIYLFYNYLKAKKKLKNIPINKPKKCLKVGIIGELYTAMEPFASYNIEIELAKMGVEIERYTNLTYLMITKYFNLKYLLNQAKDYVRFKLGADALDNIARTKWLCHKKYDGIIHTKPFGCMPEVSAIPIIDKIAKKYKVPIIYLSFDSQTSEEGIKTRLEAFYDMISMKRSQYE